MLVASEVRHRVRTRLSLPQQDGVGIRWQCISLLVALLAIWTRLPSAFLHPQFFAEDGAVWFQQAYNLGWIHSLFFPQAGYIQLFPRLVAGFALLFPLVWAPLIMTIVGALIQALPVVVLLSRRCANWGPLPTRLLMAAAYLLIADASEIHVVVTNAMWHLALLQALLAFGDSPRGATGRVGDVVLFAVGSLTGPFCLLLFPLTAIYLWIRRMPWTAVIAAMLGSGAVVQAIVIHSTQKRTSIPLGASPEVFLRIFGGDVILDSVMAWDGWQRPLALLAIVAVAGLTIWAVCWWKTTLPMRLFVVFAALLFVVSLKDPLVVKHAARWIVIEHATGIRYWFFPSLSFLWAVAWCATDPRTGAARPAAAVVLLALAVYSLHRWQYDAWPDRHYAAYVERFENATMGEIVVFPLQPDPWTMTLVRK